MNDKQRKAMFAKKNGGQAPRKQPAGTSQAAPNMITARARTHPTGIKGLYRITAPEGPQSIDVQGVRSSNLKDLQTREGEPDWTDYYAAAASKLEQKRRRSLSQEAKLYETFERYARSDAFYRTRDIEEDLVADGVPKDLAELEAEQIDGAILQGDDYVTQASQRRYNQQARSNP